MKTTITILCFCLAFASCKKNSHVTPTEKDFDNTTQSSTVTGGVRGMVSPVGAARSVSVSATINGKIQTFSAIPKPDGSFSIDKLPPGNYPLSFTVSDDYNGLEAMNVLITGNKITEIGTFSFLKKLIGYGAFTGIVSPASAATEVRVYSGTSLIRTTPDPISGKFTFARLPEGTYQTFFAPTDKFNPPSSSKVIVSKDAVTDGGTYQFESYGYSSTFNFKADDTFRELPAKVSLIAGELNISAYLSNGSQQIQISGNGYNIYSLKIKLNNVTNPGTYIIQGNGDNELTYYAARSNSLAMIEYSTKYTGGQAEIKITEIDNVKGTISGTFSGTLFFPFSNGPRSMQIKSGVFKSTYR